MAEFNDDDPIQSKTGGKWIWLGVIVLLVRSRKARGVDL